MGRPVLLLAFAAVAVFLVAGVALAQSISCPGSGRCVGTPHRDTMHGGSGHDKMSGKGGNDRMYGGSGPDNVKGRRGSDVVEGGEDNDKVKGGQNGDTVRGGPGDDVLRGASHGRINDGARDVLDCGDGVDTVYYVQNQDTVQNCEIENP